MTTPQEVKAPPGPDGDERPWYELISDVPEIPEDAMEQEDIVLHVRSILWERYAADPGALVAGPLANLIYDSATPGSVVAPDVFVVFGVEEQTIKLHRRSYRIDEWGQTPVFVLEVASESTARNDLREKRRIYARIGVPEYWRLDRWGDYYGEPLAGEHLVDGEYRPLELHRESNGDIMEPQRGLGRRFLLSHRRRSRTVPVARQRIGRMAQRPARRTRRPSGL